MRDGLERAVLKLTELSDLPTNASKVEIKNAIREHNAVRLDAAKVNMKFSYGIPGIADHFINDCIKGSILNPL